MKLKQSITDDEQHEETFTIERIWDANHDATAVAWAPPWEGDALQVGPKAGWLPG